MPNNPMGLVRRTPEQRQEIADRFLSACDAAIDVTEHIMATLAKVETMKGSPGIDDGDMAQVIRGRSAELAQLGDKCDPAILDPLKNSPAYGNLERLAVDVGLTVTPEVTPEPPAPGTLFGTAETATPAPAQSLVRSYSGLLTIRK